MLLRSKKKNYCINLPSEALWNIYTVSDFDGTSYYSILRLSGLSEYPIDLCEPICDKNKVIDLREAILKKGLLTSFPDCEFDVDLELEKIQKRYAELQDKPKDERSADESPADDTKKVAKKPSRLEYDS